MTYFMNMQDLQRMHPADIRDPLTSPPQTPVHQHFSFLVQSNLAHTYSVPRG